MWKSTDRGKTWESIGLADSHHIARILIHPRNPDVVYAAVMGHLYGSSEERGVYRSVNGGQSWERVLFANADAGAVEMCMDPSNPRILFASTWRGRRTPWSLSSGGEGSSIWRTKDGGDTWTEIIGNEGMPEGTIGISGVSVSAADPSVVYAIIESEEGGVFRSDDGGETWRRINSERKLRQRAWYYSRIFADPQDVDTVYVLNVSFWRSKDGGKAYESIPTPHGDHHDLWIDPTDSNRMVIGDDGGAQVSLNRGESFSTYYNQPTAQFYRVTVDDSFPYRIYGAQQDNSTLRVSHRSIGSSTIGERDWESTAGGESGWLAPDPRNSEVVYGGSYGGFLTRRNHGTGETRAVNVWPDNPLGAGAEEMNPRFNWNFPIVFSRHEVGVLYSAGNKLFRSTNEGQSWTAISPDLSHNDPATLRSSGGPITKDNTGVEYYATIFSIAESVSESGVIWCGTDDGRLHITRNGGDSWQDVTPPGIQKWMQFNSIDADPFRPGGAYVAGTRYKLDDFAPYLYKTEDYGMTWNRIDDGIDRDAFSRVVRADPKREGLLYAGTESGMWISLDDGAHWESFQLNLPIVPITDLVVKNDDLVVATQGRSFWVLDDLTVLHQWDDRFLSLEAWLLDPRPTFRLRGGRREGSLTQGTNPHAGVVLHYHLRDDLPEGGSLSLEILDDDRRVIRELIQKPADEGDSEPNRRPGDPELVLECEAGMHRYVWDLRYPGAATFDGIINWGGGLSGPRALPGTYHAVLKLNGEVVSDSVIEILMDPRVESDFSGLQEQFDFLIKIRDKATDTHDAIARIREIRKQIQAVYARAEGDSILNSLKDFGDVILDEIKLIEEVLYQTKSRSNQDPLNFPIRLNNKLTALGGTVAMGDFRPTAQAYGVYEYLVTKIDIELSKLNAIEAEQIPAFNALVLSQEIPAIAPLGSDD
ncbi:MAG: glycosyl hydrolase, partial [Planctomycetes bacterium]|nr:glycosyl hydrolase [Planctomycetota bacterium]